MNPIPLTLDVAEDAQADIAEIGFYLAERSRTVEDRFYTAFDQTIRLLAKAPGLGGRYQCSNPRMEGVRIWQVNGFPNHLIFCRQQGDMLQILRVIHGARDYDTMFNE